MIPTDESFNASFLKSGALKGSKRLDQMYVILLEIIVRAPLRGKGGKRGKKEAAPWGVTCTFSFSADQKLRES